MSRAFSGGSCLTFTRLSAGDPHLGADELGPLGLPVVIEVVGVDEPRRVVRRAGQDRVEEGVLVR